MPIYNSDIAAIFDEIADYLEIEGGNPFRVRAYRNAAHSVRGLASELKDMVAQAEDLTRLPGIGKSIEASTRKYNEAVGSLEGRLLPAARRFRDLIASSKEVESPKQIESKTRKLSLPEDERVEADSHRKV